MNEYNEGDLVEAVKNKERLTGLLVRDDAGPLKFRAGFHWHFPRDLVNHDFTITVIERAKPKAILPTESGYYAGFDEAADTEILVMVSTAGRVYLPNASKHLGVGDLLGDPERFAPYVKLEPRAITAKAVLDEFERRQSASTVRDTDRSGTFFNILIPMAAHND